MAERKRKEEVNDVVEIRGSKSREGVLVVLETR
jgi:hypothetical protein